MIMSSPRSFSSSYGTNSGQRKHFSIEKRPRMLKEFLVDDLNSNSSSGFKSFPRRVEEDQSMGDLIQMDLHNARNKSYSSNTKRLLRSRSKAAAAASTTISALQAIINTVKSIQFNAVKSPSILPRSLSRRLSKKQSPQKKEGEMEIEKTVRVKDIIRWKSFRDLVEEELSQPSDLPSSPDHHCATNTTGSTNTSCSNSNGSSWCDSDFTSEYLPSWSGNSEEYNADEVKRENKYLPCVGSNSSWKTTTEAATNTAVGPKELLPCEEKEQRSPVSVLDFQYNEDDQDEDSLSSFNRILDNMEKSKQKLMQTIRRFEGLAKADTNNLEKLMSMQEINEEDSDDNEEIIIEDEQVLISEVEDKARKLLNHVKAISAVGRLYEDNVVEALLLDFFVDELSLSTTTTKSNDENGISEMIRVAKAWLDGEYRAKIDWEACGGDMDWNSRKWNNKFEEEQEETAWQIENGVLNLLVDELLADLLFR